MVTGPPGVVRAVLGADTPPAGEAARVSGAVWPAVGLVCVGLAVLLWPTRPRRPGGSRPSPERGRRVGLGRVRAVSGPVGPVAGTAAVAVMVAVLWAPVGAIVVGLVGGAATVLGRWAAADRRCRRDLADLTAALRLVARELRAGASPENAVTAALGGSDSPTRGARGSGARTAMVLRVLAAPASTGDGPLPRPRGAPGRRRADPVDELTVRLVGGWRLATRTGLPLTRLVDAVVTVAEERVTALDARRAEVAGPRLSGWVLAALPAMGLLLGSAMGVDPLAVLLTPHGWGPALLVAGTALTAAGLLWSARIVGR